MDPLALALQSGRARTSQASGDDTEDLVDRVHQLPQFRAHAELARRFSRQRRVGGKLVHTEVQGPDFSGWLTDGAIHVEVEVKRVTERRLDFDRFYRKRKGEARQESAALRLLRVCHRHGGVAVVLVLYGPALATADWCPIPWGVIDAAMEAGRSSLSEHEILRHRVRYPAEYLRSPWLGPGR